MAGSLNKVMLIGNLGADPEVRSFQNGGKVCNLRLATSETWKDKSGERQERTEWHTIAVFQEGAISFAEQYLRKGSKVYVEGVLSTRKWQDQAGADRYSTEVAVRPFGGQLTSLDAPSGGGGAMRETDQSRENNRYGVPYGGKREMEPAPAGFADDTEIPF
jgi:single-strand DNA-binding protein